MGWQPGIITSTPDLNVSTLPPGPLSDLSSVRGTLGEVSRFITEAAAAALASRGQPEEYMVCGVDVEELLSTAGMFWAVIYHCEPPPLLKVRPYGDQDGAGQHEDEEEPREARRDF